MKPCSHENCNEPGIYGNPNWPISKEFPLTDLLIKHSRWCEEHRTVSDDPKYNDILMEEK